MCVLGTQITRWLPFLLFSTKKEPPRFVNYLGKALPGAVFGMLVIYCFRNIDVFGSMHALPEACGVLATVLAHVWTKNFFVSIIVGTAVYMVLLRVFPLL